MISKPMFKKISFISSRTEYMGCLWPRGGFFPGMVTSTASAASLASRAFRERTADWASMACSRLARTSLASWPMTGRSSADRPPICFSTAVSSPLLPRYLTRRASSPVVSWEAAMDSRAPWRMASNCSFIEWCSFSLDVLSQELFSSAQGGRSMVTVKRGSWWSPLDRSAACFPGPVTAVTGNRASRYASASGSVLPKG